MTDEILAKRPLSPTSVKEFIKSPKHYVEYLARPWKPPTDAQTNGLLIEKLLLQPELVENEFHVYEKPNLRTKDGKAEMELIIQNNPKKILVTKDQIENANKAVDGALSVDAIRKVIEARNNVQARLKWTDKETKLPCNGFIDFDCNVWDTDFIVDIKTGQTADPKDVSRDIIKWGYHIQAGAYLEGYPRKYYKFPSFMFVFIETHEPFNASIIFIDNKTAQQCKEEWCSALKAFRYCMDKDLWEMGYEFRLMETLDYFSFQFPGWHRPVFQ